MSTTYCEEYSVGTEMRSCVLIEQGWGYVLVPTRYRYLLYFSRYVAKSARKLSYRQALGISHIGKHSMFFFRNLTIVGYHWLWFGPLSSFFRENFALGRKLSILQPIENCYVTFGMKIFFCKFDFDKN